ncbi:Bypass of stop codon protein 6 [Colletotrichum higginsianum]|nr:Bypass of stop codon protein 6 [Colletotrichum higginsianum]
MLSIDWHKFPPAVLKLGKRNSSRSSPTTEAVQLQRHRNSPDARRDDASLSNAVADEEHASTTQGQNVTPPPSSHPHATAEPLQCWNQPRRNIQKLGFAYLSFIIAGMNDAAVGALIPNLEKYYDLNYTTVSMIFLTPFAGYSIAAFTNARIHALWGQRGVSLIAPVCHIVAFTSMALHPPFYALLALFAVSGFGNGLTDAAYCAWAGAMNKSNQILGLMHSCYALGALCAPLISTSMVANSGLPWYTFYYILVGLSVLEWLGLALSFCVVLLGADGAGLPDRAPGRRRRKEVQHEGDPTKQNHLALFVFYFPLHGNRRYAPVFGHPKLRLGLGGWIVTFMLRERDAGEFAAGASSSGFWAGMVAGRAVLGFFTERFGERISVAVYIVCATVSQLLFWLVPQFIVSAVAISLLGFFIGPLYPAVITVAAKLLPKTIHVSAIGFALALGGAGGTVFPFAVGAIAGKTGVWVLQPIVLALFVVQGVNWLLFSKVQKRD